MDPQIFPGAFVIRNTKTWGVLTALWDPEVDDSPRILIGAQDEESNRSFQVWWIEEADFGELMPNQTRPGDDGEVYYTITHMDSGLRLHTGFEDRVKSTIGFDGCERVDPEMQVPSGILPVELRDQDTCGGGNGQFWKLSHAANPDLERDNDVDKISL